MISIKYADIQNILENAQTEGSLRIECPSGAKATVLVHRMNRYRRDLREEFKTETQWDGWVFKRRDNIVFIEPRESFGEIKVFRKDGTQIAAEQLRVSQEEKISKEKFEELKAQYGESLFTGKIDPKEYAQRLADQVRKADEALIDLTEE